LAQKSVSLAVISTSKSRNLFFKSGSNKIVEPLEVIQLKRLQSLSFFSLLFAQSFGMGTIHNRRISPVILKITRLPAHVLFTSSYRSVIENRASSVVSESECSCGYQTNQD
jgi:hypothetical protein